MSAGSNDMAAALLWEPVQQSWTASFSLWSAWADAWQSLLSNRGLPAVKAVLDHSVSPLSWAGDLSSLAAELRDAFALPRLADFPSLDLFIVPSPVPAMELMLVAQQYLVAIIPVLARISQRFQAEISERRQKGEPVDSAGQALDLWNNILDRTLMEFNRSADFARLQQNFLHASLRQRVEVRRLFERAAAAVELPTRTELDDVYRRLHDLMREVYGLRRELRSLKQAGLKAPRNASASRKGNES